MRVGPDGDPEGPGQPKVCQLDDPVDVDQEVLGLQVAMEDAVGVAELDTLQNLIRVALRGGREGDTMTS